MKEDMIHMVGNVLYHLSSIGNLKELKPSIPDNDLTRENIEDNFTPRVCFAPSIDECIMALSGNDIINKEFYVYIPIGIYIGHIPTEKEVPDSKYTNEVWFTENVKVKCIGKIHVEDIDTMKESFTIRHGNSLFLLYHYNWYKVI